MYNDLQAHVRSLDALGISGEQYGVVLTPLILSRLTPELRLEWARDGERHESDLLFLLDFLQREIERRERSRAFSGEGATAHDSRAFFREGATTDDGPSTCSPVATASALHASIETGRTTCDLCGRQGHTLEQCFKLTRAPVGESQNTLKRVGACFRCLSTAKGHVYVMLNVLNVRVDIMRCCVDPSEAVSRIVIMSLLLVLTLSYPFLALVFHM